ncbi:hypothetical protein ACKWTF_007615 [Chironomus riparius]
MTEKAVVFQNYNQELVKCIEVLKRKKQKIKLEIAQDEKNKEDIAAQIRGLQEKQEGMDTEISKKKIT